MVPTPILWIACGLGTATYLHYITHKVRKLVPMDYILLTFIILAGPLITTYLLIRLIILLLNEFINNV